MNCCFPVVITDKSKRNSSSFISSKTSSHENLNRLGSSKKCVSSPKIVEQTSISRNSYIRRGVSWAEKNPIKNEQEEDQEKEKGALGLVVCFGEILINFVQKQCGVSLKNAHDFEKNPGGAPANVAVCVAKLGGSSAFIGKVGDDDFGHMLNDILKENNVDNSGMRFDKMARTALAFVTVKSDGDRHEFIFYPNPSADMLLTPAELDTDLIRRASIFHYGSISLINEPYKSTHLEAIEVAKNSGCLLSFDPNLTLPLWPSQDAARKGIMDIWDQSHIIKVSQEELKFIIGGDHDPYDVSQKLFHSNLKLLIVTEGPAGCRYYTKKFYGRVDGFVVNCADRTGAGDAFVAGLLHKFASDLKLYEDEEKLKAALKFGNGCGALTITQQGTIPAFPSKYDVMQILNKTEFYSFK